MNKLILLLITLTTFMNVSYASFPISDTLEVQQDIVQTEEIKQYHYSLQQMGIDLNDCKCESCRNGIDPLTNKREVNKPPNQFQRIWLPIIIVMAILAIVLVILLFRWADNFNKSGGIGVG
ncbi:MAG: hypothetical protein P8L91_09180 [Candidatus Marinimicrobia bacterium]|nr:hypothetical protein [Candidatus Neomarinimicrobiota bacterium]